MFEEYIKSNISNDDYPTQINNKQIIKNLGSIQTLLLHAIKRKDIDIKTYLLNLIVELYKKKYIYIE